MKFPQVDLRVRPCLQDGARRHRVETEGLGVPFGTLAWLAQNEEPDCTSAATLIAC
jgi:hypothetical protein